MLELNDVSLIKGSGGNEQVVLQQISAQLPDGHCIALLGPSGSGIGSLLKVIAGIISPSKGTLSWNEPGQVREAYPGGARIGFIPRGNYAPFFLTVSECIEEALRLRVRGLGESERKDRNEAILEEVGLGNVGKELVGSISDEQQCRLKLGIELTGTPRVLLCEDIATELDPRSELEILALLHRTATERKCLLVMTPGNLRHLEHFDSLMVVHEGHLTYHGPGEFLLHYFNIGNPEGLFPRLSQRRANEWHGSWGKHRAAYYSAQTNGYQPVGRSNEEPEPATSASHGNGSGGSENAKANSLAHKGPVAERAQVPVLVQTRALLARQWKSLTRRRARLLLRLTMIVGLPCLVIIFGWGGLSKMAGSGLAGATRSARFSELVSGLVMGQTILLGFAGAVNGVPGLSGRRSLFEKEKFDGLRPFSSVVSRGLFLAGIAAVQSFWMAFFVKQICHFPGSLLRQGAFLFCVNFSVTAFCMGIAAVSSTRERARLAAFYLAAVQLPFSGVVLALPEQVSCVTRLVAPTYWGWAGYLQTFDGRFGFGSGVLPQSSWCFGVLGCQCLLGFCLAVLGARRNFWAR